MELLKIALQDSGRVGKQNIYFKFVLSDHIVMCIIFKASLAGSGSNSAPAKVATPTATQVAMQVFREKGFMGFFQGGTATLVNFFET
jgi:hypothetical protein